MEENGHRLCGICKKGSGRYQCPRCNTLYCSADCYKCPVHSHCSEEFYEECVRNEMSSMEPNTQESQKKMLEILKRLHENFDGNDVDDEEHLDSDDDLDEDDDTDLAERLKDVNLDEADKVWEKLTDSEKQQFEQLLKSNDITEILPEFDPWWNYKDDRKIIDLEEASPFENIHKNKCPEVCKKIPPFGSISKSSPAPNICCNLANVLSAYVFVVRYFNGDHHERVNESTISIITISKNLSDNENYFDFPSAIKSVFLEITNSDFLEGCIDDSDTIARDVKKIFEGPDNNEANRNFYVLSALSDIHTLFSKAVKHYGKTPEPMASLSHANTSDFSKRFPDSGISTLPSIPKLKIKSCLKKIEYYMSWSKEFCNNSLNFCW